MKGQTACGGIGSSKIVSLVAPYLAPIPNAITSSTGSLNACIGSSVTYSVTSPTPTATQAAPVVYRWTKPANTTITSANTDSSNITLQFNTGYGGGSLTVKGQTSCGTQGGVRSASLTHSGCPSGTNAPVEFSRIGNESSEFALSVFPNPSTSQFNIVTSGAVNDMLEAHIYDMQGRELQRWKMNIGSNRQIGADLKPGAYIMQVSDGKQSKTTKLFKY